MASFNDQRTQVGTLYWLEIPVLCTTRAAAFYAAVFGWDCTNTVTNTNTTTTLTTTNTIIPDDGDNNDTFVTLLDQDQHRPSSCCCSSPPIQMFCCGASNLRGAFLQVPEECLVQTWDAARPSRMAVLTTFAVRCIESTLGMVVEMGGRVHMAKTFIGSEAGYFARFVDSEGNLQGIWARS